MCEPQELDLFVTRVADDRDTTPMLIQRTDEEGDIHYTPAAPLTGIENASTVLDGETPAKPRVAWDHSLAGGGSNRNNVIKVEFDTTLRDVTSIRLCGYRVHRCGRSTDRSTGNEVVGHGDENEWIALKFDEFEGTVISNSKHASRAFAIINLGDLNYYEFGLDAIQPMGLTKHHFQQPTHFRALNLRLTHYDGTPVQFGVANPFDIKRIHLWFKVCVKHR